MQAHSKQKSCAVILVAILILVLVSGCSFRPTWGDRAIADSKKSGDTAYCVDQLTKEDLLTVCPSMQAIEGVRIDTVTLGFGTWHKCSIVINDQENPYGTTLIVNIMENTEVAKERFRIALHDGVNTVGVSNLGDLAALIVNTGETDLIIQRENAFLELTRTNSRYCSSTDEFLALGEFLVDRAAYLKPTLYFSEGGP